jgi:hypothetical protein
MQQFTLSMLRHAAKKLLEAGPGPSLAHEKSYAWAFSTRGARDWIFDRLKALELPVGTADDREDLRRLLDDGWGVLSRKKEDNGWSHNTYAPVLLIDFDPRQPDEQAAFENWVIHARPGGDVEQVQHTWTQSTAHAEFQDQRKEYIKRMLGTPNGLNPSNLITFASTPSTNVIIDNPKETTMSSINVTTPVLVNGTDISKLSDGAVYEMIRQAEAEIANLESIKNKPVRLKAEVEKLQAGINDLVKAMNARDAKA